MSIARIAGTRNAGEVTAGTQKPSCTHGGRKEGRTGDGEITVFKSVGYAMEDAVTARLAYERAADSGVGATFDLEA